MKVVDDGSDIILRGYLTDNKNEAIQMALVRVFEEHNFINSGYTNNEGYFEITIPTIGVGVRHLRVVFDGNDKYNCCELTDIEVTVREPSVVKNIHLETDKITCQLSERITLTATCKSQYNELLSNIPLVFKQDNTILGVVSTNKEGIATLRVTPNSEGEFNLTASVNNVTSNIIKIDVIKGNLYEVIADLNEKLDNCSSGSSNIDLEKLDVDFNYAFGVRGVQDTIDINIFLKEVGE